MLVLETSKDELNFPDATPELFWVNFYLTLAPSLASGLLSDVVDAAILF